MGNNKKYWNSLDQLNNDPALIQSAQQEFSEQSTVEFLGDEKLSEKNTSRRDFLKFLGFSVTAASLAACETPVNKAIPYLNKPEDVIPGVPTWYASSYYDGMNFAGILVKTREGRPIHITGNPLSVTRGRVNARINSSVLELYDETRLRNPLASGKASSWEHVDGSIASQLGQGGEVRILTGTVISPSTNQILDQFASKYNARRVTYDPVSYSAIRKANNGVIPSFDFSKAKVIVSIGADFLSSWLNSPEYTGPYGDMRRPEKGTMNKHYQFETNMTLSGANADFRTSIKPSEHGKVAVALYNAISGSGGASNLKYNDRIAAAAKDLQAARGNSLVIAGSNDINVQVVVAAINRALGNYGSTIDTSTSSNLYQGNDADVMALTEDMKSGKVKAIFIYGVNPVYSLPNGKEFADALKNVPLSVSFAGTNDETAKLCKFVCPDHHYLESWNDFQPNSKVIGMAQPTIRPLYKTRAAQESFMKWSGIEGDYMGFIKGKMGAGWNQAVHDGGNMRGATGVAAGESSAFAMADTARKNQPRVSSTATTHTAAGQEAAHGRRTTAVAATATTTAGTINTAAFAGAATASTGATTGSAAGAPDVSAAIASINGAKAGNFELQLYVKEGIGDGRHANNPWLQELPDPISKVCWDNYVTMSPKQMEEMGLSRLERGDQEAHLVTVTANGKSITLPAYPQPGQAYGTVGIAVGYGRAAAGKVGTNVGKNAYPLVSFANDSFQYQNFNVKVEKAGGTYLIATTQSHHTLMGRDMVKETSLANYRSNPKSGNPDKLLATQQGLKKPFYIDLWREHPVEGVGHRWGMTIDLNTCIGCGSCVTACNSENNVPVVGKDEIRRSRDMHWMRIDRYYSSDAEPPKVIKPTLTGRKANKGYTAMEKPSEHPEVVFQPMLCQHCNHAPCETVCPVVATSHSNEGLNMMTYNRCIGTRYCANNCPYKVRRFNWFNYVGNSKFSEVNPAMGDMTRMVLNPDVVVRTRGVMEKCSFCVQRVQAGKLEAKKENRPVIDGDVTTACAAACPTNAIIFGDLNDDMSNNGQGSHVRMLAKTPRAYNVLEEVGTRPNVFYLTKVRNIDIEIA